MREMKDSGVEWIGEIPIDWKIIQIKKLLAARDGGSWGEEPQEDQLDRICYRVADFDFSRLAIVSDAEFTIRNYTQPIIDKLSLERGDILVEKSGGGDKTPVGRAVFFDKDEPALFANFIERLRVATETSPRYFFYVWIALYLTGFTNNYIKQTTGIQNLDIKSLVSSVYVPSFDLNLQYRIADYLDTKCAQIDRTIARQQEVIEKLKEYKLSVITEAVTKGLNPDVPMKDSGIEWIGEMPEHWETVKLKFLLSQIIDCPHETPNYNPEGEYYVIRTADQDFGYLRSTDDMYRLDKEEYVNRTRRLSLDENDIVYGREGERWGLACLVPETARYCLGQRMMQFRCDTAKFLPFFAMWALNSKNVYLQGMVDTFGSTSPHVNISTIRDYSIPLPELIEQKQIAEYLCEFSLKLEQAIKTKQALIEKLTEYKKSLVYEVVTGKREV